jgi:hypothetical protein
MAKAGGNTTTTWISLLEARALVVRAYGATHKAEDLLKKWLGEEKVRWSCKLFEPARVSELAALQRECVASGVVLVSVAGTAYSEGDPAFWCAGLQINWQESWACEKVHGGNAAYGIRVVCEDVLALLPEEPGEHEEAIAPPRQHRSGKKLIEVEVKRRAAEGERWDSITDLSEDLHEWMKTVSDKPLQARTIENYLRGLDLRSLLSKK